MKFKLKATPKDWLIFAIFAVVLLFAVSILVVNINTFATTGSFAGLNPFIGFGPKYISMVLVFYFVVLIFLFVSVSSHFYDKEKGFGISFGETDKGGYSRFATTKEMKQKLDCVDIKEPYYNVAGFPLINDGKKIWLDNGESHNLVIGSTGAGKTQDVVHPLVKILIKKGESMIITDPKGEIYKESAGLLKERGYKIVVLNFREPQRGNSWNPLALPYKLYKRGNVDKAMELLDDVASNILYEEGGNKDAFWEKTSADFFAGLTLGLFEDAKEEEVNINSISVMASVGEERFGPRSSYIKEYFNGKNPASAAYTCASGTVYAPEETKGSILSTFKQKIRIFASRENLSEMLSTSDFDMDMIGKEKTAVFMIIQDEKKTYHALATIFIKQCYESLIDVAQHTQNGALPIRTNFILDEFQNMPPLKDVTTMVAAARSRHIRLTMIIQNFAGLEATYSKEIAQTIRSNCNNLLYLLTTELSALEEISKLCGEKKVKVGKGDKEHEETRPLISVSELQLMKENEAIVIKTRCRPYKTKLYPNWKTDWGINKTEADPFVQREKKPIATFDLKAFVQSKKQDSMMTQMDNNPFTGLSSGINPFAQVPVNPLPFNNNSNDIDKLIGGSNDNDFDVDELVKRIDEKIAELEKEEEEREKLEKEKLEKEKEVKEVENTEKAELKSIVDEAKDDVSNIFNNSKKIKITEDEFFDDFFDE